MWSCGPLVNIPLFLGGRGGGDPFDRSRSRILSVPILDLLVIGTEDFRVSYQLLRNEEYNLNISVNLQVFILQAIIVQHYCILFYRLLV